MANIIEQLKRLLARRKAEQNPMFDSTDVPASHTRTEGETPLTKEAVMRLLRDIEATREEMYNCEETFALLDEYAELVSSDEEAERLMPLVKAHLDKCPDCHERYEVLIHILKTESSGETA